KGERDPIMRMVARSDPVEAARDGEAVRATHDPRVREFECEAAGRARAARRLPGRLEGLADERHGALDEVPRVEGLFFAYRGGRTRSEVHVERRALAGLHGL